MGRFTETWEQNGFKIVMTLDYFGNRVTMKQPGFELEVGDVTRAPVCFVTSRQFCDVRASSAECLKKRLSDPVQSFCQLVALQSWIYFFIFSNLLRVLKVFYCLVHIVNNKIKFFLVCIFSVFSKKINHIEVLTHFVCELFLERESRFK